MNIHIELESTSHLIWRVRSWVSGVGDQPADLHNMVQPFLDQIDSF
jgi:hypothetical protein